MEEFTKRLDRNAVKDAIAIAEDEGAECSSHFPMDVLTAYILNDAVFSDGRISPSEYVSLGDRIKSAIDKYANECRCHR